jgi:hypothetical protein
MIDEKSGTTMMERPTRRPWDYAVLTIHARHNNTLEEALREKGQEGWELSFVTMPIPNEYQCVFRRPF